MSLPLCSQEFACHYHITYLSCARPMHGQYLQILFSIRSAQIDSSQAAAAGTMPQFWEQKGKYAHTARLRHETRRQVLGICHFDFDINSSSIRPHGLGHPGFRPGHQLKCSQCFRSRCICHNAQPPGFGDNRCKDPSGIPGRPSGWGHKPGLLLQWFPGPP